MIFGHGKTHTRNSKYSRMIKLYKYNNPVNIIYLCKVGITVM